MTWRCECGAATDNGDTRALPHTTHCPIFDGKPVSVTLDPPVSPESLELSRVRKQLALAITALEYIDGNFEDHREVAYRAIEAIKKAGRE